MDRSYIVELKFQGWGNRPYFFRQRICYLSEAFGSVSLPSVTNWHKVRPETIHIYSSTVSGDQKFKISFPLEVMESFFLPFPGSRDAFMASRGPGPSVAVACSGGHMPSSASGLPSPRSYQDTCDFIRCPLQRSWLIPQSDICRVQERTPGSLGGHHSACNRLGDRQGGRKHPGHSCGPSHGYSRA